MGSPDQVHQAEAADRRPGDRVERQVADLHERDEPERVVPERGPGGEHQKEADLGAVEDEKQESDPVRAHGPAIVARDGAGATRRG